MAGLSTQQWRQRGIDKQREEEARINMLQRSLAQQQSMGDANAK